jgi:hypothetical protein
MIKNDKTSWPENAMGVPAATPAPEPAAHAMVPVWPNDGIQVLSHDQAMLLPKPVTFRDSTSGVVVTLN